MLVGRVTQARSGAIISDNTPDITAVVTANDNAAVDSFEAFARVGSSCTSVAGGSSASII